VTLHKIERRIDERIQNSAQKSLVNLYSRQIGLKTQSPFVGIEALFNKQKESHSSIVGGSVNIEINFTNKAQSLHIVRKGE
jgi:hypothetical protein